MKIIFDIGLYIFASSIIMIGYVWYNSFRHSRLGYDQSLETTSVSENTQSEPKENLAA